MKIPSCVTAVIQRSAKAKPKTVHIDKLKVFLGKPPTKWSVPGFVDQVYSPDDVVVRSDEARGDANSPRTSEEGRRRELNEAPIENLSEFADCYSFSSRYSDERNEWKVLIRTFTGWGQSRRMMMLQTAQPKR